MPLTQADQILGLLRQRHSEDVFIAECKDGPTWTARGGGHLRLDAWAMKRSWASPATWGYEIKVSRRDFLADEKWPGYLPLCSDFYFVCPRGLIDPKELPPEPGLLWAASTGTRLWTKKKAQHRQIDPPTELLIYALMRAREYYSAMPRERTSERDAWSEWLETRANNSAIGRKVAVAIASEVRQRVGETIEENRRLTDEIVDLGHARQALADLGLLTDDGRLGSAWNIQGRIRKAIEGEMPNLEFAVAGLRSALDRLESRVNEVRETTAATPTVAAPREVLE